MDYLEWFPDRLVQLRLQKGVSARDMSLSLGQCESYINKIENRKALPSMTGFFLICEYLCIEPKDFFSPQLIAPTITSQLATALRKLKPHLAEHLLQVAKDLSENN